MPRRYLLISALVASCLALGSFSAAFAQSAYRPASHIDERRELEHSERQVRAAQAEQIRQAQERGNEQRRDEWRASEQARQPAVVVQPSPEPQPETRPAESPAAVPSTTAPEAPPPVPAKFPVLRLGLALFASMTVLGSGWALYRFTGR